MKGKEVQEGWIFFKDQVLKEQEQAVPMWCEANWQGRQPAWLNRAFLLGLKKQRRV